MALSVPSPCSALDSNRAATTRSQQRVRKDERSWTTDTFAPYDDGHQWRKYGEKKLSNSKFPRFYYRCTYKNDMKCPATKQVQQKDSNDPPLFSVTYFNHHTCNSGDMRTVGAPEPAIQSSSRKAVSICFNSCAASDQNPFRSPSSTAAASPAVRSSETKQQLDRSTYTHHFQWASGVPSPRMAPVKMEVDDFAETSAPSGTGAPSRTLLPIGQSRCIEYFHFL